MGNVVGVGQARELPRRSGDLALMRKTGCVSILLYSHKHRADLVRQLNLTPELIGLIADRFKALSEPARLQILNALRRGEQTVNELVDATGLGQANVSKHLQSLFAAGFVRRRKEGLFTCYALADRTVFRLCDIMCGRLEQELASHRKVLAARA